MKAVGFLLALFCIPVAIYFLRERFFPPRPFDPAAAWEQEKKMGDLKQAELEFKIGRTIPRGKGIISHPYIKGTTWMPAIELTAEYPVSVSYIPAEYERHLDDPGLIQRRICLKENVREVRFLCPFPGDHAGYLLYVQDDRDPIIPWPENDNKVHLMVWEMPPDSKFARELIEKQNHQRQDPQAPQ
jgi:hypothetical protein